jgi:hypothetical protein
VGFLVRAGVPFRLEECKVNHFLTTQLELCEITVKSRQCDLRFINVYCPPKKASSERDTAKMCAEIGVHVEGCLNDPCGVIVLGDLNAHNRLFGAEKSDPAGEALAIVTSTCGLRLLNDKNAKTQPYAVGGGVRWSAPDMAFATPEVASTVTRWMVGAGLGGCSHRPVTFEVGAVRVRKPTVQFRWKASPAAKEKFREQLQGPLSAWVARTEVDDDLDGGYRQWRRVMLRVASAAVGRRRGGIRRAWTSPL